MYGLMSPTSPERFKSYIAPVLDEIRRTLG